MASLPLLPFWTDAYIGDTHDLSQAEHGCYLLLMLSAWRSPGCSLPNDDQALSRYAHCDKRTWTRQRSAVLERFFTLGADGRWFQKRLLKEWQAAQVKSGKATDAARTRWKTNGPDADPPKDLNSNLLHRSPEPERENPDPNALENLNTGDADASNGHIRTQCTPYPYPYKTHMEDFPSSVVSFPTPPFVLNSKWKPDALSVKFATDMGIPRDWVQETIRERFIDYNRDRGERGTPEQWADKWRRFVIHQAKLHSTPRTEKWKNQQRARKA